jgi:tetratricopeptide (TPR) repeat protein
MAIFEKIICRKESMLHYSQLYRLTFVVILLFVSIVSMAQNSSPSMDYIDSALVGKSPLERYEFLTEEVKKYNSNDLATRLRLSKEMLNAAKALGQDDKLAYAYYELTYSYEIVGEYDRAIDACFKGLKLYEELGNQHMISMSYNELGLIYSVMHSKEDYQKAVYYFNRFLEIQEVLQDTAEIAGAYSNIGLIYIYRKMGDSAFYYSKMALDLRLKIQQQRTIPISYGNVGVSYYLQGNSDSAIVYYLRALEYYKGMDNPYGVHEIYGSLIPYYIEQEDYENARKYVYARLENSKTIQSKFVTKSVYYSLSEYHKAIGEFEKALDYFVLYKSYVDSLSNDQSKRQINNLQTVYDLDKTERELSLAHQENKVKQLRLQLLLVGIVAVVFLAVVIILYQRRKRRKDSELFEMEREVHQKDKQLAAVELEKSQMKEGELQRAVEYKSKQLTTHALNMMKKNQFLHELENSLSDLSKSKGDHIQDEIKKLNKLIKRNTKTENDWELFRIYFEEVNSGFYEALNSKFPSLSANDYKLCALIKLNMNIKESASVLNISPESVKTARYRLRKKLNVAPEQDLHEFIQGL